jgi:hypothetical protein
MAEIKRPGISCDIPGLFISTNYLYKERRNKSNKGVISSIFLGFHSINCPYKERQVSHIVLWACSEKTPVSIQLIAPTKRDFYLSSMNPVIEHLKFPFN